MPGVTVITPTGGRPEAFALCEKFMARQAFTGEIQWLISDDVKEPTPMTMGQAVRRPEPFWQPGQNTQFRNILALLPLVRFDKILFFEDDDWYGPGYVAAMVQRLDEAPLVGEIPSRYYNVRDRRYFIHRNDAHASLCQTAMRAEVLPLLKRICERKQWIDMALWPAAQEKRLYQGTDNVGIKGLPGRPGQVSTHRRTGNMAPDPNLAVLRSWIGEDAELYRQFAKQQ